MENKINIVYYIGLDERPETRILRTLGFVDSRSQFGVSLKPVDPEYKQEIVRLKQRDAKEIDYQFSYTNWI